MPLLRGRYVPPVNNAPVVNNQTFLTVEGTTAVGSIVATDPDAGAALTYGISGGDAALFSCNAITGEIEWISPPSYGGDNSYSFTITVTDDHLAADTATITVEVVEALTTLIPEGARIGCTGDSLTAQDGIRSYRDWLLSALGARVTPSVIYDFGVGGEDTVQIARRAHIVDDAKLDLLIYMAGRNNTNTSTDIINDITSYLNARFAARPGMTIVLIPTLPAHGDNTATQTKYAAVRTWAVNPARQATWPRLLVWDYQTAGFNTATHTNQAIGDGVHLSWKGGKFVGKDGLAPLILANMPATSDPDAGLRPMPTTFPQQLFSNYLLAGDSSGNATGNATAGTQVGGAIAPYKETYGDGYDWQMGRLTGTVTTEGSARLTRTVSVGALGTMPEGTYLSVRGRFKIGKYDAGGAALNLRQFGVIFGSLPTIFNAVSSNDATVSPNYDEAYEGFYRSRPGPIAAPSNVTISFEVSVRAPTGVANIAWGYTNPIIELAEGVAYGPAKSAWFPGTAMVQANSSAAGNVVTCTHPGTFVGGGINYHNGSAWVNGHSYAWHRGERAPVTGLVTTAESAVIPMTDTSDISVGQLIVGTDFPTGTTVASINPGVSVTASHVAVSAGSGRKISFVDATPYPGATGRIYDTGGIGGAWCPAVTATNVFEGVTYTATHLGHGSEVVPASPPPGAGTFDSTGDTFDSSTMTWDQT